MEFVCPVCGYDGLEEPFSTHSYEICDSCGFEFGVTDDDLGYSYKQWRERWISVGMAWWSTASGPPEGWDPEQQLRRVSA